MDRTLRNAAMLTARRGRGNFCSCCFYLPVIISIFFFLFLNFLNIIFVIVLINFFFRFEFLIWMGTRFTKRCKQKYQGNAINHVVTMYDLFFFAGYIRAILPDYDDVEYFSGKQTNCFFFVNHKFECLSSKID